MDPDVGADNIDTVETAPVTAADGHVVSLTVSDGVHDKVEHGCVDEDDIVDGEVVGLFDAQEASAVALAVLVIFISKTCVIVLTCTFQRRYILSLTLNSTLASTAKHLEIIRVANEEHVTRIGTSTVDDAIELQSPCLTALKRSPRLHSIVTRRDNNSATGLAGRKGLQKSGTKIGALVSLATVVQDIASLDFGLSSMRSQGSNFA